MIKVFKVSMHVLSPVSVPVEFEIEAKSRSDCMQLIWKDNNLNPSDQRFILDQNKPWRIDESLRTS